MNIIKRFHNLYILSGLDLEGVETKVQTIKSSKKHAKIIDMETPLDKVSL